MATAVRRGGLANHHTLHAPWRSKHRYFFAPLLNAHSLTPSRRGAKVARDTGHGFPRGARALDHQPVLHAPDARRVWHCVRRRRAGGARGATEVPRGVHHTTDDEHGDECEGEGPGAREGAVGADGEDVGGYWGVGLLDALSFKEMVGQDNS